MFVLRKAVLWGIRVGLHRAEELGIKMVRGPGWNVQGADFNST